MNKTPSPNFAFLAHHDARLVALGTQAEEHFATDANVMGARKLDDQAPSARRGAQSIRGRTTDLAAWYRDRFKMALNEASSSPKTTAPA